MALIFMYIGGDRMRSKCAQKGASCKVNNSKVKVYELNEHFIDIFGVIMN